MEKALDNRHHIIDKDLHRAMSPITPLRFESGYSFDTIAGSVLLLPTISVANVPQLTVDVLLHTLSFVKVATLNDEYLHSFISPVDYVCTDEQPKGVSFGIELYYCKDKNLTMVQQRAPVIAGFYKEHVNDVIMPFVNDAKFKNVILFHLMGAGLVENIPIGTLQVYTNEDQLLKSLSELTISEAGYQQLSKTPEVDSPFVNELASAMTPHSNLSILVAFAYEGDNFYDSLNMASKVADLLNIQVTQWRSPVSWAGVYGDKPISNAMEDGLYC